MTTTEPRTISSTAEAIERARALLPVLKQRAAQAEDLRQVPPETVQDLKDAGLLRIPNPPRFGGYEMDVDTMFQVGMELGRACGSTAWCSNVWGIHNWMVGHWPEQAQEEYFASGPDTLSSSSFGPMGKLTPVDGGYRMTGRWEFSSGSNAGAWALLGAMGERGPVFTLVPRPEYQVIEDTWHVSGLKGTGSKDVVVEDAFVPYHRTIAMMGMGPMSPASGLHSRDSYKLFGMSILPFTLCSPLVGMAQGIIDAFTERYVGKTGPGRSAESVALQLRLAESSAEVDTARLIVTHHTREMIERVGRGETLSELDRATYARDIGFVAKLSVRAANRLFEAAGGHSLFDSDPIQRLWRDTHAGAHQMALYWDNLAEGYGRAAFGLPALNFR
jgi:3-hydroxy-9,10-secoandrosta-1,3,5(10)-triene-9,17-dione monooxygenase